MVNQTIKDAEQFDEYLKRLPEVLAEFGGRILLAGKTVDTVEGDVPALDFVGVLEFPSVDDIWRFYHSEEYKPLKKVRHEISDSRLVLVEGQLMLPLADE
jgi:uncharacterized protein (DUF1330 family)